MQFVFSKNVAGSSLVIHPIFGKEKTDDAQLNTLLKKLSDAKEFDGKEGQTFYFYESPLRSGGKLLLTGLGATKKLSVTGVMTAFGAAIKSAAAHSSRSISLVLPKVLHIYAQAIGEAITMASYQPSIHYKTGKAAEKLARHTILEITVVGLGENQELHAAAKKGATIGAAVNQVRDWVNAPPNYAHSAFFIDQAKKAAKESGADLTVLNKRQLTKLGMGAILGVNRGSTDGAVMLVIDYKPKGYDKKQQPLVFAGKGILFDSGGYNLKPRGYIEDMQLDKAGAAALIALVKLLPLIKFPKRVIMVTPFTENVIGPDALKPSEILKTYSGKTVEITNTDAEGRLVLCDAISYAIKMYNPKFVIDIATLTGACMVALGERYAGIFGSDQKLIDALRAAGDEVDELLWPLPIHKDDAEKVKGHYADLRNSDTGSERFAGASKGAAFLQAFVEKTPWVHLDIASPAFVNDPKKYETKGATGFGVRLLLRFLEKMAI